eukprot:TRINITY_DN13269_c1_g2_i1.p1 TRINITY_DN13269_c1_g2~~TRINITY_DN13269_c1_g2_i1.p1  ORF type:complete len:497 (-),score=173.60 TRINITY_DN13269_c1_g2_i1:74-1564(-)
MRSILFFQEIKNKRMKKIKSKAYRKRKKAEKEAEKEEVGLQELADVDEEAAMEEKKRRERERAEMRMSLRAQKSSKWLKQVQKFSSRDDTGFIDSLKDHSQVSNALRQKMASMKDESQEMDGEEVAEALNEFMEDQNAQPAPQEKGLMGMSFMKKAAEKRRKEAEELLKELNGDDDEHSAEPQIQFDMSINVKRDISTSTKVPEDTTAGDAEVDKILSKMSFVALPQRSESLSFKTKSAEITVPSAKPAAAVVKAANPFLDDGSRAGSTLTAALRSTNAALDMGKVLTASEDKSAKLDLGSQKDLVQEAFVDDDDWNPELEELQKEKGKILDCQMEGVVSQNVELPGWGSWAGDGSIPENTKKVMERKRKKRAEADQERQEKEEVIRGDKKQKLDHGLDHVIFNTAEDVKLAEKYQVSDLPRAFRTEEEYIRALTYPVGREWNTESTFKELAVAPVKVKSGSVINPITWNAVKQMMPDVGERLKRAKNASKKKITA